MTSSIGPDSALWTGPAVTELTTDGKVFIFGAMCRCFQDNRLLNKWTFDPAELSGFQKMGHWKSGIQSNLRFLVSFRSICLRVNVD